MSAHPKARTSHGLIVLVNAEIVEASRNEKGREGCMSVPELTGDVKRATLITIAGQLPGTGDDIEITTDAFEARALQHEIDHCAGSPSGSSGGGARRACSQGLSRSACTIGIPLHGR